MVGSVSALDFGQVVIIHYVVGSTSVFNTTRSVSQVRLTLVKW